MMTENTFSKRFFEVLFEKYPEWKQYLMPPDLRWQTEDDMAIEVPSRFAPSCPLRIETACDHDITVSWAGWHTHNFPVDEIITEEKCIADVFEMLDEIFEEKQVLVMKWHNGPGGSSALFRTDNLSHKLENERYKLFIKSNEQVVVISWNGTYDQGPFDPAKC